MPTSSSRTSGDAPSGESRPNGGPRPLPAWLRGLLLVCGTAALVLGIAGAFLPLLPTTPLVLVAAACYARSSERAYRWLLAHRWLGPLIRQWRDSRTVPPRAKWIAIVLVAAAFASTIAFVPNCIYGYVTLLILASVLLFFLLSLDSGPRPLHSASAGEKRG